MSNKKKQKSPEPDTSVDVTTDRDFKGPIEVALMNLTGLNATLQGGCFPVCSCLSGFLQLQIQALFKHFQGAISSFSSTLQLRQIRHLYTVKMYIHYTEYFTSS